MNFIPFFRKTVRIQRYTNFLNQLGNTCVPRWHSDIKGSVTAKLVSFFLSAHLSSLHLFSSLPSVLNLLWIFTMLHRKRKLSVSGPATKDTLLKKFKEEIDAEARKKMRLEWYLKQLLIEKEMLVKQNEIEFEKAIMMTETPTATCPTSKIEPEAFSSVGEEDTSSCPPFFRSTTNSITIKREDDSFSEELPSLEESLYTKHDDPFGTEWEHVHCWWADEEVLSQITADPPSLVV